ncbi:MAG TPA: DUF4232 domain-containing protein [Streptosporangiaceae bacterium]|nr:DUF4232 domain-containing protein [Streptosporangiaceae bacterium]
MARSTRPPRTALWAIIATVGAVALTAGPATALSAPLALGRASGAATCQASDLHISVPVAIKGDPAQGMGKQAWNLLFRNTGSTACSLRGWPRIAVRTPKGKPVATTVTDAQASNLAVIPDARIVLWPGQTGVVTAISPATTSRCVPRWTLGLTLPGAGGPVTVGEPASSFAPCVGGRLQLSPFYAEQTLTRDISALSVSAAPPPFTVSTAAEPAVCAIADLRARVTSTSSQADGSVIEVRLANSGPTCVLATTWPTVQVHSVGDADRVAKIFADTAALRAERALLTTYERGARQRTALTLRKGAAVAIAVLAPRSARPAGAKKAGPACQRVTAVTIYASDAARGPGREAGVTTPVSICAAPRILSFLPGGPGRTTMTIARGALQAIRGGRSTATAGNDTPGYFYGTDSSAPDACGNGPYTEPVNGDCSSTDGPYGEYVGELGSYENWQGCTTSGLAWDQGNYNMANDNIVQYGVGIGAAGYWFAAGPGRDPKYNGTASEAMTWGEEQAEAAVSEISGLFFNFRYIFMDIENNGVAPDENGWNTVWNGPCGNNVQAEYVAPNVDYATYLGFVTYIDNNSPYSAGVYSAGGSSYASWSGIFGSEAITGAAEWTFTTEQAQLSFPAGFSASGASPSWFASAPAACDLMWQWSGGDGVLNNYGDFDQVNGANNISPAC